MTRRINGGFNGLEDRLKYYERAKSVLASGFDAGEATTTRSAGRAKVNVPAEPLLRGAEAIEELAPTRRRRPASATKKTATEKTPAKKVVAKKSAAKKTVAKKVVAKKAAPRKVVSRKLAPAKSPGKRAPAKKAQATRKTTARKSSAASRSR